MSEHEVAILQEELDAVGDLSPAERQRLLAHGMALLRDGPRHAATMKRLMALPEEQRRRVTGSALAAVLADGHASPAEIKFLERLYTALGLPREEVYAAIHRGHVVLDEPVTIRPEQRVPGTPIPPEEPAPRPRDKGAGVAIDEERLARIRTETEMVRSLLADVFLEEEKQEEALPRAANDPEPSFDGLDSAHSRLVRRLLEHGAVGMSREAFENEARALRLLPEGALETINDWGFENFDEPVIEEEEMIVVAEHLRSMIQGLEKAA